MCVDCHWIGNKAQNWKLYAKTVRTAENVERVANE